MAARIVGETVEWKNYHETVAQRVRRLEMVDHPPTADCAAWLRTGARLVGEQLGRGADVRPLGTSWSFSRLSQTEGDVFSTKRLSAVWPLAPSQLAAGVSGRQLRLVAGGTKIKDLNQALEAQLLSLRTSGASNGQSVAGATATGTHGSVPAYGGFQDHVRGLHLVTGPERSIWLEPSPFLSPAFTAGFASEHRTDPVLFDAALVHLGGMGFVNAMLIEAADRFLVGVVQRKVTLGRDAIDELAAGRFDLVAARIGFPDPYFLQVILNPFRPWDRSALIRLLVPLPERAELAAAEFLGGILDLDPLNALGEVIRWLPDGARGQVIAILMRKLYPVTPAPGTAPAPLPWSATTPDHRKVGDLYSTGIAIERTRLGEALDAMLPAFRRNDGGDAVCTLRFVRASAGALAIARDPHNVVVDFDGLRTAASRKAYGRALAALDGANIPSRQHWGKLSHLDAARVRRDHGDAVDRWRAARSTLLGPDAASFRSRALIDWGLA